MAIVALDWLSSFTVSNLNPQLFGHGEDVLVPATAQIREDDRVLVHLLRALRDRRNGVRRLQRGNDPLGPAQQLEGFERLVVGDGGVFDAADVFQPRMLGADARVVEPCRDRDYFASPAPIPQSCIRC